MELFKDIAAVIGCILSIISLITICTKGGRSFIKSVFKRHTRDIQNENQQQSQDIKEIKDTLGLVLDKLDAVEEVSKQQCRNIIKIIYYKYYSVKRIPLYERKTADRTYEIYHNRFNGNSYASLLYQEICKWEIDTTSYDDNDEE